MSVVTERCPRSTSTADIILTCAVGCVFLVAGAQKILFGVEALLRLFNSLGVSPAWGTQGISRILAVVEVLVGLWLMSGVRAALVVRVAPVFLLGFTLLLVYAGFKVGWHAECGCSFTLTASSIT